MPGVRETAALAPRILCHIFRTWRPWGPEPVFPRILYYGTRIGTWARHPDSLFYSAVKACIPKFFIWQPGTMSARWPDTREPVTIPGNLENWLGRIMSGNGRIHPDSLFYSAVKACVTVKGHSNPVSVTVQVSCYPVFSQTGNWHQTGKRRKPRWISSGACG